MKVSQRIFTAIGLLSLISGVVYIALPLLPYHETIIGMTVEELASNQPKVCGLMETLIDVAGLCFLALGICVLWIGYNAWKERMCWLVLLIIFCVYSLPMTYVVYIAGGPVAAMGLVVVLTVAGLVTSGLGK